jgi:4-hydroxy-3-methylbut-2-enyl diphosphate reductase
VKGLIAIATVILAGHSGFCFGVRRAVETAEGSAPALTLGPIIHNPQVVSELEVRGVTVLDSVESLEGRKTDTVVIRSHGVGPSVREALEQTGVEIADATCPHVLRAQRAAHDLAVRHGAVVVVGDPVHPEVSAIKECAELGGGRVWVVDSPEHLPDGLPSPVGVVVQTTQNRAVFEAVLKRLEEVGVQADVKDTICSSTAKRQQAARELAAEVDAMVVIGGRNSSNTTRLYEICKQIRPRTFHVEKPSDLDISQLSGCETVGITAGASTPEDQIAAVEELLRGL